MYTDYRSYRHSDIGFTLSLPKDWEASEEVDGCALVALESNDGSRHFFPNIVITVEPLREDDSLDAWVQRSREAATQSLRELRIIDTEQVEVDGLRAWRTLSHYMHPSGGINLEQWSIADGEWGYVVSCSTSVLDYDAMADTFAYMAESLRVGEKTQ